jgi:hypothetical protein
MAMLNELRVLGVDDLRDLVGLYFTEVAGRQGDLVDCGDMLATLEGELDPTKLALNAELAVGSIG